LAEAIAACKTWNDERFLRFGDSPWYEGVFRNNSCTQKYHWTGSYYEICSEGDSCPLCVQGNGVQKKHSFEFVLIEAGKTTPKILELPATAVARLQNIPSERLLDSVVHVSRDGKGRDTKYSVRVVRSLTQAERDEVEEIPLFDLDDIYSEKIRTMLAQHQE